MSIAFLLFKNMKKAIIQRCKVNVTIISIKYVIDIKSKINYNIRSQVNKIILIFMERWLSWLKAHDWKSCVG
jgi:AAA15 family ATPase/GTPase